MQARLPHPRACVGQQLHPAAEEGGQSHGADGGIGLPLAEARGLEVLPGSFGAEGGSKTMGKDPPQKGWILRPEMFWIHWM